jgi:hypothetical protein
MAFSGKANDVPRDPSAIEDSAHGGGGLFATVILLLIVASRLGSTSFMQDRARPRAP